MILEAQIIVIMINLIIYIMTSYLISDAEVKNMQRK